MAQHGIDRIRSLKANPQGLDQEPPTQTTNDVRKKTKQQRKQDNIIAHTMPDDVPYLREIHFSKQPPEQQEAKSQRQHHLYKGAKNAFKIHYKASSLNYLLYFCASRR